MADTEQMPPADAGRIEAPVGRPAPERAGLLTQIEACRREVAQWPAHMRVVATLRMHPAAMGGADL